MSRMDPYTVPGKLLIDLFFGRREDWRHAITQTPVRCESCIRHRLSGTKFSVAFIGHKSGKQGGPFDGYFPFSDFSLRPVQYCRYLNPNCDGSPTPKVEFHHVDQIV